MAMNINNAVDKSYETKSLKEIADAPKALEGKTELDAVIAYLQGLGLALKQTR